MGTLDAISLFSGAGGMDVGFEAAGFKVLWANELDVNASNTYTANHPGTELVVGDIDKCLERVERFNGVSLVFGGPPCQGFSVAGKMDPADRRSLLVWSFFEAVRIANPRAFVMENVKALAENEKWSGILKAILEKGRELGYDVAYRVLDASRFGVPQKRERVFIIGIKGKDASEVFRLVEERQVEPPTVRETLLALPPIGSEGNPVTCTAKITPAKSPILRPSPYKGSLLFNGKGRVLNLSGRSGTIPAALGGNNTPIVDEKLLRSPDSPDAMKEYHSRILNGDKNVPVPNTLRRLSATEAAALQTFPIGYKFTGPKSSVYRQIGNAVPCRLAKVVAQAVHDLLC